MCRDEEDMIAQAVAESTKDLDLQNGPSEDAQTVQTVQTDQTVQNDQNGELEAEDEELEVNRIFESRRGEEGLMGRRERFVGFG